MNAQKESWWKRELKEIFAISYTFFVLFILFTGLKLSLLEQYHISGFKMGAALIGSLILAKVVLILDKLPLTRKMDIFPNIYRVFFRSFVYLIGFVIFSLLEHWVKSLVDGDAFGLAWQHAFQYLGTKEFALRLVVIFIVFLFFNAFWVIRVHYGPKELRKLFFGK